MHNVCRVDIGKGDGVYKEIDAKLRLFAKEVRKRHEVHKILVFGSFVRKDLNEGSDIDIIIVGDFKERFHKRIATILGLTDLPIEPLCYTVEEFDRMVDEGNLFMGGAAGEGVLI
ncbi:MAG: nucleotidyltransferase domain-containing protein [Euryarchaeota archaeon]|nr:nucleotidyltransferase domain-containing protein [Euryarchaeota archaeon]